MDARRFESLSNAVRSATTRRVALGRLLAMGAGAALGSRGATATLGQEATPTPADACVASAPPPDASGIGFAQLLVGGIVPDMPTGPVEVRISRLAMAPGTLLDAEALPFPFLMYIETGTTACPGGAGRVSYAPDGTVTEVTTAEGVQYTPAGSTQYVPANVPDGAGNEETALMSSLIIEFVPAGESQVSPAATPAG